MVSCGNVVKIPCKINKKRIFVFKHCTLYWIRADTQPPLYPQKFLRFDPRIKKLKPKLPATSYTIQMPSKSNYLRCDNMKDLNFTLIYMQLHYLNIVVMIQKDQKVLQSKSNHVVLYMVVYLLAVHHANVATLIKFNK